MEVIKNNDYMKNVVIFGLTLHKFPETTSTCHVTQINCMKKVSFTGSLFRSILLRIYPRKAIHYYNVDLLINALKNADAVIIFDAFPTTVIMDICMTIDRTFGSTKECFFYYWNPVKGHAGLTLSTNWKCRCFDYNDSLKYNIPYVSTFYVPVKTDKIVESSDIFFVGKNKGRFQQIKLLEKKLTQSNIKCIFKYVSKWAFLSPHKFCRMLPYGHVISYVKQTKCVLDITQIGQVGLTQRFMEALFYNKKILTNNRAVRFYSFYNENKVRFIEDDAKDFSVFLQNDNPEYDEQTIRWYGPEAWLERIFHPGDKDLVQR